MAQTKWEAIPQFDGRWAIDDVTRAETGVLRLGWFLSEGPAQIAALAPEMEKALREHVDCWINEGEIDSQRLRRAVANDTAILARLDSPPQEGSH